MKKVIMLLSCCAAIFMGNAQFSAADNSSNNNYPTPKLVVGIVVDQMRWDYLYRFYDLYQSDGGFKRLLNEGFSCDNTLIPYLPTVTAVGHSSVYTGSVPAIHGITNNQWFDNNLQKIVYCTEDNSVQTVGSSSIEEGKMSPNNLFVTTVTDELRLSSNFKSKVIGISIKDRGAILPAGHAANAAYWFDGKSGNFITSTYYMNQLPNWVQQFNERKLPDSLFNLNWNLRLPQQVYETYCDDDKNEYESAPFGKDQLAFPYTLQKFMGKEFGKLASTPYGNSIVGEMAKAAIANENLGKNNYTDFLAVSFSSTDYVGHSFGPNSWELLDTYIRLDETLSSLLDYLDKTVGKNNYTVFLTADHAGAHIAEFLQKHKIPGGRWSDGDIKKELNKYLQQQFNQENLISAVEEWDVYLNHPLIDSLQLNEQTIQQTIVKYLLKQDDKVLNVVDKRHAASATVPAVLREMIVNGYNPQRSGDLQIIAKTGIMDMPKTGMTHGAWNAYDSHIPLLFYGWGIKQGSLKKEVYMTDIAPTIAALLHIQMPSGNIGKVITEVMK